MGVRYIDSLSKDSPTYDLAAYVSSGLEAGDNCVIVARPANAKQLCNELTKKTGDPVSLCDDKFNVFNAEDVLADFMVNNLPDKKKFYSYFNYVLDDAVRNDKSIKAYCEMIAILRDSGNETAADRLDKLWNEFAASIACPCTLLIRSNFAKLV